MRFFPSLVARCTLFLVLLLFSLFFGAAVVAASNSGRMLYRSKCASCHGRRGQGNARMKAPALVSAEIRDMSDDQLKQIILQRTNGEMERKSSHARLKRRLNAREVSDLKEHIRRMQQSR